MTLPVGITISGLYNGMVAPYLRTAVKGFVWYQGEQNSGDGYNYQCKLTAMIQVEVSLSSLNDKKDWRRKFVQSFDPFFIVIQLSSWTTSASIARLRYAQYNASLYLSKVGIVASYDQVFSRADFLAKFFREIYIVPMELFIHEEKWYSLLNYCTKECKAYRATRCSLGSSFGLQCFAFAHQRSSPILDVLRKQYQFNFIQYHIGIRSPIRVKRCSRLLWMLCKSCRLSFPDWEQVGRSSPIRLETNRCKNLAFKYFRSSL